ncbi:uncharacterized protein V6R79_000433 [Siganus canaliculatus]
MAASAALDVPAAGGCLDGCGNQGHWGSDLQLDLCRLIETTLDLNYGQRQTSINVSVPTDLWKSAGQLGLNASKLQRSESLLQNVQLSGKVQSRDFHFFRARQQMKCVSAQMFSLVRDLTSSQTVWADTLIDGSVTLSVGFVAPVGAGQLYSQSYQYVEFGDIM